MGLPDNCIPEEKLPQCWSDDVRMNALFAPFRLKTANPESWDMKMKFWSDMLRQWCKHKKDPILSAADAKFAFQRKGRTPACVEIVVEELYRSGELSPLSKYQQILHSGPESWVRWGARLAFKPAAFALTAVASLMPARQQLDNDGLPKASIDSTQRFVLESAVKEQAIELLQNYPSSAERVGTIEELMRNYGWQRGRETFEVLLGYLVAQGSAVKKDEVVKLAEAHKKASPVSASDEALVRLLSAESRLGGAVSRLTREAAAAAADARAAVQLGNKLAAKSHLRRKHRLQQRVDRCEEALHNVRQLLQQLREVEVNAAVVDTYRISSQAMKSGMKESGLEEDAVHETMDDLKEVLESYNEVEKALSNSVVDDFDAAELEQELKDLMSGPGAPSGGTPDKNERREASKIPSPSVRPSNKKVSERDFVFDGEERMIAELNELSVEDASPKQKEKIPVAEDWEEEAVVPEKPPVAKSPKPSRSWYPSSQSPQPSADTWSNNNIEPTTERLDKGYQELRQDERLHPGQQLNVDFTSAPHLYSNEFQVQDHTLESGVWLYNRRDNNSNVDSDLATSTEYFSSESPGKTGGTFQMAPGGERKKQQAQAWPEGDAAVEELERRLRKLRGSNL